MNRHRRVVPSNLPLSRHSSSTTFQTKSNALSNVKPLTHTTHLSLSNPRSLHQTTTAVSHTRTFSHTSPNTSIAHSLIYDGHNSISDEHMTPRDVVSKIQLRDQRLHQETSKRKVSLHHGGVDEKTTRVYGDTPSSDRMALHTPSTSTSFHKSSMVMKPSSTETKTSRNASVKKSKSTKGKSVDQLLSQAEQDAQLGLQYQRMSQREHILLRPEPYIGSPEVVTERTWVLTKPLTKSESSPIIDTDFNYIPGLYKIFDEILVNASDNVHRNTSSIKMKYIAIAIDPKSNQLSVENDGASIPVVMHPTEGVYVPELIFGHLLTSSNYDDSISRFTGGRHGYGAKLTNIFSKSFQITVGDADRNIIYHQEFQDNMSTIQPALLINTQTKTASYSNQPDVNIDWKSDSKLTELIESLLTRKTSFTRIQFQPDLTRFQVDKLTLNTSSEESAQAAIAAGLPPPPVVTHDRSRELISAFKSNPFGVFPPYMMPLFERRIVDIASLMGRFGVKVSYNGNPIGINTYHKYLELCPSFPLSTTTESSGDDVTDDEEATASSKPKDHGRVLTTHLDDNWFIGICPRPNQQSMQSGSQSLNHLSFVNSVATMRGGSHVNYIMDIVSRYICNYINQPARRKQYELENEVNLGQVRQNISTFVSCYIHNPSFDSQTKDTLITHIKGPQTINPPRGECISAPQIPEAFLKRICRDSGVVEQIVASAQQRQHRQLIKKLDSATPQKTRRSGGLNIEKLDDALWAGSSRSRECTLILTEGDSAKALAVSGLSVLGREKFGIYPLKGKLLNVRDASKSTIANNKELVEIMQILGLKLTGSDRSNLRYGSILVMADQDHDGSHIKGLVINVLHTLCPDLVRCQVNQKKSDIHQDMLLHNTSQHQFVRLFVTPIVKATYTGANYPLISIPKRTSRDQELGLPSEYITSFTNTPPGGSINHTKRITDHISQRGKVLSFYSQQAYKQWWSSLSESLQNKFKCKYYKGLGTSTSAEGKDYFNDLPSHIIDLIYRDQHDDKSLDLAFSKDQVDARKHWVMKNSQGVFNDDYIRSYLISPDSVSNTNTKSMVPSSSSSSSHMKKGHHHNERGDRSRTFASRWTSISDFIHNELVQFSVADTARSLPSQLDGLKPSQRKIIYAALAKPLTSEVRVSQFAAYVSEKYVYHHGEQSLTAAVVNLAQDYPGTNNIPLLTGVGQFGTRYMGGKDAASPRYIYTRLGPLTSDLFPLTDVPTLPQQEEEGTVIEPAHLLPILPLMIINGSSGIGTGFSTDIPPHNPLHVLEATVQWLRGEPMRVISPLQIGMQTTLSPAPNSIVPFESNYKTIDQVDLSTIHVPKVDAPWDYTKPSTDITIKHKYPWDSLYADVPSLPVPDTTNNNNHNNSQTNPSAVRHKSSVPPSPSSAAEMASSLSSPSTSHTLSPTSTTTPSSSPSSVSIDHTCTKWISTGRFHIDRASKTLHITELPYNSSTAAYKKFLFSMSSTNPDRCGPIVIERIEERHTEHHVWFTLHFADTSILQMSQDDILTKFKLQSNVMLTNMNAFGNTNELQGFTDVRIPLAEYCVERLETYEKRRSLLIEKKWQELELCRNKTEFCTLLMNGTINLTNKTKKQLVLELHKLGFTPYDEIYSNSRTPPPSSENKDGDDNASEIEIDINNEMIESTSPKTKLTMNSYNYLFKIPVIGATRERVEKIQNEMKKYQHELASLTNITAKEMWLSEIAALQPKLEKYIESRHRVTSSHPFFSRYGNSFGSNSSSPVSSPSGSSTTKASKSSSSSSSSSSRSKGTRVTSKTTKSSSSSSSKSSSPKSSTQSAKASQPPSSHTDTQSVSTEATEKIPNGKTSSTSTSTSTTTIPKPSRSSKNLTAMVDAMVSDAFNSHPFEDSQQQVKVETPEEKELAKKAKEKAKAKAKAATDAKRKKAKATKLLAPLLKTTKKLNKHLEKQQESIRKLQEKLKQAQSAGPQQG